MSAIPPRHNILTRHGRRRVGCHVHKRPVAVDLHFHRRATHNGFVVGLDLQNISTQPCLVELDDESGACYRTAGENRDGVFSAHVVM